MRKFQTEDVFKFARIIRQAELKDIIKKIFLDKEKKSQEELGYELIFTVIEACTEKKIEDSLYEFLGGVFEIEPEEVRTLFLDELMDKLKQVSEENNLGNFMKLASRFT